MFCLPGLFLFRVCHVRSPDLFTLPLRGWCQIHERKCKVSYILGWPLELTVWRRLTLNLWFFCLSLLNPSRGYKCTPPCPLQCRVRNRAWGLVHVRPTVCQSSHILRHYVFLFHSASLSPLFLGVIWTFHSERTNYFLLSRNDLKKSMLLYSFRRLDF